MIVGFRHRGLRRLYERGDGRGIAATLVAKTERILARLDEAQRPSDMALPGLRLHPLKGNLQGYWSVTVSANWRVIFRFDGPNATDVDLVDYH
jgi:proteic killer suppression protein